MWSEIFKHMKSKDRKSFRISCKRWRDCCNRQSIQKMEKLHLPGISRLTDMVATLLTSKRSILNLKFSNHRFEGVDLPIWQEFGPAIEHLELENCAITHSSMKEILIRCTKLSYLALRNVQIVHAGEMRRFGNTFIRISQSEVIASSVTTLVLDIYELLTDTALESLLSIFPNVKELEFDFHHLSHLTVEYREPELFQLAYYDDDEKAYTCENFAKCLATNLLQLERLKVKSPSRYCKCDEFIQETPFFKYVYTLLFSNA